MSDALTGLAAAVFLTVLVVLSTMGTLGLVGALVLAATAVLIAILGPARLGVTLVVAGVLTAPMNAVRPVAAVDLVTFSDLFLLAGLTMLAPTMLRQGTTVPARLFVGSLLMATFWVLGSLAGPSTLASLGYLLRMLSASLLLPLGFLLWRPPLRVVDRLVWAYVVGQAISTLVGLAEGKDGGRYVGLTTHPNFFGMCGALAFGLCLYLVSATRGWLRAAAFSMLLWSAASVLLSGSRAALLAIALVTLIYPLLERSTRAGYVIALLGAVALGLADSALLPSFGSDSAVGRLSGGGSAAGSDAQRTTNLIDGVHALLAHPLLGEGFSRDTAYTHNGYLEIAQATGLVGLVGYLIVLSVFLAPLFRGRRRNRLAYAALAYAFISTFTNTVWDRFAWTALLLALLHDHAPRSEIGLIEPVPGRAEPRPALTLGASR